MRHILCGALFGLLAITPAMAAQKDYNGRWSISATTEQGHCVEDFRLSISISNGMAYVVGHSVNGSKKAISENGQVNIKYVEGNDVITAKGALKGRSGSGKWAFPAFRCIGHWHAERK
jgi:hypothetical protein